MSSKSETKQGAGNATRESILQSKRGARQVVPVDAFGKVTIKSMTARQRGEMEDTFVDGKDRGKANRTANLRVDAILMTVIDPETGAPLFVEEDREGLLELDNGPVEQLYDAIAEMNGFSAKQSRKQQVDDAVKNSDAPRQD